MLTTIMIIIATINVMLDETFKNLNTNTGELNGNYFNISSILWSILIFLQYVRKVVESGTLIW